MESVIRVFETPNAMEEAFENPTDGISIVYMVGVDKDPEPNISNSKWKRKYGEQPVQWSVQVNHPDNVSFSQTKPYSSWQNVLKTVKRQLREQEEPCR